MADENMVHPEFLLRLPNGGPQARGRLLPDKRTNGSWRFVVEAGQPVRPDAVTSFLAREGAAHRPSDHLS